MTPISAESQRILARHSSLVLSALNIQLGKTIRISDADKIRIIRFLSWSRRFGVPLSYVIGKALEWGTEVSTAKIRARRKAHILPMAISALTGNVCYEFVAQHVHQDYGHEKPLREALRSKMLRETLDMPTRSKGRLLDFESLTAYAQDYETHTRSRQRARFQAEAALAKTKPFRGNPFR